MSKFNRLINPRITAKPNAVTMEGNPAFSINAKFELMSILLTSFGDDKYYRSAAMEINRLKELISYCEKEFVAKAIVFARTKFGMRTITHIASAELAKYASGQTWAVPFYDKAIYRPDDMMEIVAYYNEFCALKSKNSKRKLNTITSAMKQGFAKAFGRFDEYSLAKYRGEGKAVTLEKVMKIVHPTPNERNSEALAKLKEGTLKSFDTWETELTQAGQNAKTDEQKEANKSKAWNMLVKEKKIGYFALLKNLRNIIESAPSAIPSAIEMLTDEKMISKSLVLPFRYLTAYEQIEQLGTRESRNVLVGLTKAIDISLSNMPKFNGETLIALDVSGSMTQGEGKPARIGGLFTAALAKQLNCDVLQFDSTAKYVKFNPADSVMGIYKALNFRGGSTNFVSIFQTAKRKYDRIIILSDAQANQDGIPTFALKNYCKATGANPTLYMFDLQGYGTIQFPENKCYLMTGFNEKIFDVMSALEKDRNALVHMVEEIDFYIREYEPFPVKTERKKVSAITTSKKRVGKTVSTKKVTSLPKPKKKLQENNIVKISKGLIFF